MICVRTCLVFFSPVLYGYESLFTDKPVLQIKCLFWQLKMLFCEIVQIILEFIIK